MADISKPYKSGWPRLLPTPYGTFIVRTPAGFKAQLRYRVWLERADEKLFYEHRMLSEEGRADALRDFHRRVMVPMMRQTRTFLMPQTIVYPDGRRKFAVAYHRIGEDNKIVADCIEIVDACLEYAKGMLFNGCTLNYMITPNVYCPPELVEENYRMIDRSLLDEIRRNPEFTREKEAASIALEHHLQHLRRSALQQQRYIEDPLTVLITTLDENSIKISWQNTTGHDCKIYGFRDDVPREPHGGGTKIVESTSKNGDVIDHPEPRKTWHYIFFAEKVDAPGFWSTAFGEKAKVHRFNPLRFQIHLPATDEVNEARRLYEVKEWKKRARDIDGSTGVDDPKTKVQEIIARTKTNTEAILLLFEWERSQRDVISALDLDNDHKEELLETITASVENAIEKLNIDE